MTNKKQQPKKLKQQWKGCGKTAVAEANVVLQSPVAAESSIRTITVFDYDDVLKSGTAVPESSEHTALPGKLEVHEAFCVGGETGILAYFRYGNMVVTAVGDDGHWKVAHVMHMAWFPETVKAMLGLAVAASDSRPAHQKRAFDPGIYDDDYEPIPNGG
jgi:hypothetical protein